MGEHVVLHVAEEGPGLVVVVVREPGEGGVRGAAEGRLALQAQDPLPAVLAHRGADEAVPAQEVASHLPPERLVLRRADPELRGPPLHVLVLRLGAVHETQGRLAGRGPRVGELVPRPLVLDVRIGGDELHVHALALVAQAGRELVHVPAVEAQVVGDGEAPYVVGVDPGEVEGERALGQRAAVGAEDRRLVVEERQGVGLGPVDLSLEVDPEAGGGVPPELGPCVGRLQPVGLLVQGDVVVEPVLVAEVARHPEEQLVLHDGAAVGARHLDAVALPRPDLDEALLLVRGLPGLHQDGAGDGVAAVEGALGPLHHRDALDVVERLVELEGAELLHVVDHRRHRRLRVPLLADAPDGDEGAAAGVHRPDQRGAGRELEHLLGPLDLGVPDLLLVEGRDADRCVTRGLDDPPGRDADVP